MESGTYQIIDGKVVMRIKNRICETPDELLSSRLFYDILRRCIRELARRNSRLMGIFAESDPREGEIRSLIETLKFLAKLPADLVVKLVAGSDVFFRDKALLNDFVEYLYNYWRSLQRLIICETAGDRYDQRPYRTFNSTIETLTHLVRSTYRDVQENITGAHPRIYRQVRAGAEIATIALNHELPLPAPLRQRLASIPVIRQVLIYPPLIFTPPMNKRTGMFERVALNPLDNLELNTQDWLCYPAKVGPLLVHIYFSLRFFELGFSLSNLFELADDADLNRAPDAVYLYGVPEASFPRLGSSQTIFYDDETGGLLIGVVPDSDRFGYFGYLKKMVLTLHNIKMMKLGRLPFHGALVNLALRGKRDYTVLIMGDTGAGKSESLEALRAIGADMVEEVTVIADDMGSLAFDEGGRVLGYGTETGAFVRLDDLKPGYAFGQIDRTIIMSPNETNARVVLPVTNYATVMRGYPIDLVLYANNYDVVDDQHPLIERFNSSDQALDVFRAGAVMSKGTTTTTGKVGSYFANVFGPAQYQGEHEPLAQRYFEAFFERGIFVGQFRTQLGVAGKEQSGPEAAARALLELLNRKMPE